MKTQLIVCHDAGGAEILAAMARRESNISFAYCLEGPAQKVFIRKFPNLKNLSRAEASFSLNTFATIITGTGWASDLEKYFILQAREHNVPSVSFLDHWSNYRGRFLLKDRFVFPEQIWVGDSYAENLARQEIPECPVFLKPNFYFEDVLEEIKKCSLGQADKSHLLYVTEPTSAAATANTGDPLGYGYTEFEALEAFLIHLSSSAEKKLVRLRQHPSEEPGKYIELLGKFSSNLHTEMSAQGALAADLAWADTVAGCNSMAMAMAVFAKKKVFCCIPAKGKDCSLPFVEIHRIFKS